MKHLELDAQLFDAYFDRKPFYVSHRLMDHPLFSLKELAALSTRLPAPLVEADDGQTSEKAIDPTRKASRSPAETILQAAERPAAVTLRQVQNDPRYQQLLDEILDEMKPLTEKIRPGMCRREGFIFVSSCQKVTPYHFDPEHNFLLQVRGHKTVYMWDPNDRFVLSERTIEDSYLHPDQDLAQRPHYDERYLSTA
ncbi:MAG TPA: cupin-like domain-containing protein, partial [Polyangia bacterium]